MAPILAGDHQVTHPDLHGSPGRLQARVWVSAGREWPWGEDHFEHEVSRPGLCCRRLNARTVLALMLSPAFGGGLCTPWVCFEHSCVFSVGVSRRTREPLALAARCVPCGTGRGLLGPVAGPAGSGAEHLCGRWLCGGCLSCRLQGVLTGPAAPAPAPAVSLRRPLLAALCSRRGEHGRRLQNPEFCVANSGFPQLCPPGGRRLLTLGPGTAELPENVVLCPRPPGGTLHPPGFVRPGGGTANKSRPRSASRPGTRVSRRWFVSLAACVAPWTARPSGSSGPCASPSVACCGWRAACACGVWSGRNEPPAPGRLFPWLLGEAAPGQVTSGPAAPRPPGKCRTVRRVRRSCDGYNSDSALLFLDV